MLRKSGREGILKECLGFSLCLRSIRNASDPPRKSGSRCVVPRNNEPKQLSSFVSYQSTQKGGGSIPRHICADGETSVVSGPS